MLSQELITYFLEHDILLSPELLEHIQNHEELLTKITSSLKNKEKLTVLTKELTDNLASGKPLDLNWGEFEKSKSLQEKGKHEKTYETFLNILNYTNEPAAVSKMLKEIRKEEITPLETLDKDVHSNVTIIYSYNHDAEKRSTHDFVEYFRTRYEQLKHILLSRPELQNCISINRVLNKKDKERIALIVMVTEKQTTKNGNILLTVEDITGRINILINKDMPAFALAKDLTEDEVIGITGTTGTKIIFANNIFQPDVPLSKELKKSPDEAYMAVISDIHFGSKYFLKQEFLNFVEWINGKTGNVQQRAVANKLKYLFIVGDVVDGVGIYPGQEANLEFKDVTQHYDMAAEYLSKIRKDVHIILCPGQHDAVRISEPQPILDNQYTQALKKVPNLLLVTNPALVNIHASKDFPGFDVLMYHGASYHYFVSNIDSLRAANSYDNPTVIQRYLLQNRHLAPAHGATLYTPRKDKDPLVIDRIPDIFASGDMHRCDVSSYNNVTLVTGSTFQDITDFMIKVGANPNIARVKLINLKTREVKILNFFTRE